jgi:hypothetical protein
MRDLGLMGESTFSLWCAEVGLIANGSQIDKTGWDFFVEFPYSVDPSKPADMQGSPIECKVQVKATDKTDRKLSITLSNLRRLVNAQMPVFFLIIEFGGSEIAQNAFLVHVGNDLISKVLKRIREIDQSDKDNKFNKRTMMVHYGEEHKLSNPNGTSLKEGIVRYVANGMEHYVKQKHDFVNSTGFDNGLAQINFSTHGEENLRKLIDVSLGIEKEVDIASFHSTHCRFGIKAKEPFVDAERGRLLMPNLKRTALGIIRFRESRLSPGISFQCKLFNSPFNPMLPKELVKFRVEGDFFDLKFNPFSGEATYSFSFGGVQMEIIKLRDAIKLLSTLNAAGHQLFTELDFEGFPKLEFSMGTKELNTAWDNELKIAESAAHLSEFFNLHHEASATLQDLLKNGARLNELSSVLKSDPNQIKIEFSVADEAFDPSKEVACMFFLSSLLGTHIVGVIYSAVGRVETTGEHKYRLNPSRAVVDRKIAVSADKSIEKDDLIKEFEQAEKRYENDNIEVVRMFE